MSTTIIAAHKITRLTAVGLGSFAVAAAAMGLAGGTAHADVTELAPGPEVTSRQATLVDPDAVRVEATQGERRSSDVTVVRSQGEVRDTTKAVPGTTAAPFVGEFPTGPSIGTFGVPTPFALLP